MASLIDHYHARATYMKRARAAKQAGDSKRVAKMLAYAKESQRQGRLEQQSTSHPEITTMTRTSKKSRPATSAVKVARRAVTKPAAKPAQQKRTTKAASNGTGRNMFGNKTTTLINAIFNGWTDGKSNVEIVEALAKSHPEWKPGNPVRRIAGYVYDFKRKALAPADPRANGEASPRRRTVAKRSSSVPDANF